VRITKKTVGWAAAIVVIVAALMLAGRQVAGFVPAFVAWVDGLGWWGPALFIAGYVVATVAMVPGTVLTLAAGAVFGIGWGFVWVLTGATLGAIAAFLVSRYLARGLVEKRLADERFKAVDRAVGDHGFKIVALLRLSPAFPFNVLNYALGLTRVRLRHYGLACLAMAPGTLLYVYYGALAGDIAAAAAGEIDRGIEQWLFLGLGLVATVIVTIIITRIARRALREKTADPELVEA
jgi:uncharacterized membrane protein YdjX (TVP38/TMEM64 family)